MTETERDCVWGCPFTDPLHVPIPGRQGDTLKEPGTTTTILFSNHTCTHKITWAHNPSQTATVTTYVFLTHSFQVHIYFFCLLFPALYFTYCLLRVCVCVVLFLPHLLSLWCAWWFNIANWCQTTKLYSLFTVLSLFWLSLYLSLPSFPSLPCLLLYSLICSGGLVARLQDFHITSFFCCQRIYFCFFPIALFALGPLKLWIYLIIYSFLDFLRNCLHSSAWVTRICIRTLFYL